METIQVKRKYFEDFNSKMRVYQYQHNNSTGYTFDEIKSVFAGMDIIWFVPAILVKYINYGCCNLINDKFFFYWDTKSCMRNNIKWNHFVPGVNNIVSDYETHGGIIFDKVNGIWVDGKDYLDAEINVTFDETSTLGRLILKIKENMPESLKNNKQQPIKDRIVKTLF